MISSDVITQEASYTEQMQAAQARETGTASANLTSTDFLNLLMEQLQYQDPLDPVDNAEFISQQCQFSQLSASQEMNANSSASRAASLVGENVTLTDPENAKNTITGLVTSATINGTSSSIKVNGTEYPLKYLKSINQTAATPASTQTDAAANTADSATDSTADNTTTNTDAASSSTSETT